MLEKPCHPVIEKVNSKNKVKASIHPSHSESLPRLKKVQGQLEGITNMINDGRYCPDIINQIRAAVSALKSVEGQVIERHLRGCINNAIKNRNEQDLNKKIEELTSLYIKGL